MDSSVISRWVSTFFTGILIDLLIIDVVFMVLAVNIRSVRNLVQLRGFFSGKIVTLEVLKKEKVQSHLETVKKRLYYL